MKQTNPATCKNYLSSSRVLLKREVKLAAQRRKREKETEKVDSGAIKPLPELTRTMTNTPKPNSSGVDQDTDKHATSKLYSTAGANTSCSTRIANHESFSSTLQHYT